MIFAEPWILAALAVLPVLWFLLRVTPPAPRTENFPAIRLLLGLHAREETPARTPWWLLLLRLVAAGLVIVALARPVLDAGASMSGSGPVLLVIDNGWASAPDWSRRMEAAGAVLDRAGRAGRDVGVLATAADGAGEAPRILGPMAVSEARSRLAAVVPRAWGPDRLAAAVALEGWAQAGTSVVYIGDGVMTGSAGVAGAGGAVATSPSAMGGGGGGGATTPPPSVMAGLDPATPSMPAPQTAEGRGGTDGGQVAGSSPAMTERGSPFPRFAAALSKAGAVTQVCCAAAPPRVLLTPESEADRLIARVAQPPQPMDTETHVLAQSGDGRTLARAPVTFPAGAGDASTPIPLPPELRNRLSRLVLEGPASAGAVALLDERWRRRPVGLVAGEQTATDSPFTGALYYLRRALGPFAELRDGDVATLLQRDISVLVLADRPLPPGVDRDALAAWVEKGGLLIRFAGPRSAEAQGSAADTLLPVPLLGGDRQLGGALSWSEPAGLAPFPTDSPFAGLAVPEDVKITRQVLAEPSAELASRTWAGLADGTPLVTQAARGAGRVVLFHVTANADWSNLPLSGLFVDMLRRLVALSAGIATTPEATVLAPAEVLDGFGVLSPPQAAATGLAGNAFARMPVSPRHPPGLYGPENGRRALNVGSALTRLDAAPPIPGATIEPLADRPAEREIGPWLMAAAILLLAVDMLIALALRGLLRTRAVAAALMLLILPLGAQAQDGVPPAAVSTRLGHILTGDPRIDETARAGLVGLSEYVNRRTSAVLSQPDGVDPGRSDLSFYPLLYWPITADIQPLSTEQAAALNRFMAKGGIILIDTRDSGSGAGFAPGTDSALRRVAQGLTIPALAPVTMDHVLSRSFYLLSDFPGRFTGDAVWAQRDQDRANDSVSPVIIGGHDWASAWAVDAAGRHPHAVIPGGQRQRVLAYRFGVNVVMYALTGNYKGDQVHVPAILQRLGQ